MVRPLRSLGVPTVLATLAISAAGCAPPDLTASYELSGYVSERFESGEALSPIAGVTVTFVSDTGLMAVATTGADGRYRMIVETDTAFGTVRAHVDGFEDSVRSVFFDTPVRRVDIDMRRPR